MHSVISQGRVEEIVHSKPRDRRLLIEEAAGLGKHRKRRRRAQLKLERTRDNLDRALDVEREARSRLRPLKRQAKAAETHARLERESMELRARLLGDRLCAGGGDLAAAEARAPRPREPSATRSRPKLAEVDKRAHRRSRSGSPSAIASAPPSGADLTALRAAHERLGARTESIVRAARPSFAPRSSAAAPRWARWPPSCARPRRDAEAALAEQLEAALRALGEALARRSPRRSSARRDVEVDARARARPRPRAAPSAPPAPRAAPRTCSGTAARTRSSAGSRPRPSSLDALGELCDAARAARATPSARAPSRVEEQVVGGAQAGDDADRASCASARAVEAEIQAELRVVSERGHRRPRSRAAQLRDRRDEAAAELGADRRASSSASSAPRAAARSTTRSASEIERRHRAAASAAASSSARSTRWPSASTRRRKDHVAELERPARGPRDGAWTSSQKLIRETDREITAAFEETFEAAARELRGADRAPVPGRPRPAAAGRAAADPRRCSAAPEVPSEEGDQRRWARRPPQDERAPRTSRARGRGADDSRGVEIEVTPAGKATRRLSLLSGGEKSLVALAFVFAVFLARPSPFYILDEVEAALDDANIDRFLQLVRRFSDRAQFVDRHPPEAHDGRRRRPLRRLDGEDGVTKVISRAPAAGRSSRTLAEAAAAGEDEAEAA